MAAVVGTNAGDYGPGNTCMWCHRSRVDVTNYIVAAGNRITSVYWGPHEGPQADLFTGRAATSSPDRPTRNRRTSRSSPASTATWSPWPTTETSPTTRSTRSCRRASSATPGHDLRRERLPVAGAVDPDPDGDLAQRGGHAHARQRGALCSARRQPSWATATGRPTCRCPAPRSTGACSRQTRPARSTTTSSSPAEGPTECTTLLYIAQILFDSYGALAGAAPAAFPARPQ